MNFICDNNNFLASEDCNSAIIVNPNLIFWKRLHGRCESCTVVLAVTVLSEFSSVSLRPLDVSLLPSPVFFPHKGKGERERLFILPSSPFILLHFPP